jgi:2-polyprenyl-6-methoxyphenol hydroxylase-like FAD-dependent oxidoreductase
MPNSPIDVLVVGAGPVGLTMAADLIRHGLNCRIIDKAAAPTDKSKALVVWSRSLELLANLGLAEIFVDTGLKAVGASIYGHGKRLIHIATADVESPYPFPLMIPQSETERLLTEHLSRQGLPVERCVELVSFTEQPDGVICTVRHADGREEMISAAWLVGCDGAHSAVRHTLGMPFTGQAEPNDWLLADVHIEGPLPPDEVSVFWHEKGVLVCFPINRDRFRVIADLGFAKDAVRPPDPTLADAQAKVDERGPRGLTLTNPVWLAGFRINERKVSDYRRGRVMLAGDAAHIHSPAGGQGMNTGMQDAFNLGWKLALVQQGLAQAQPLLESYSRERSGVGDQVLRGAEKVTTMATLRNPVAQFLRNHIAPIVVSFGLVQDKIKNALCELNINYRKGPLSAEDWHAHGGDLAAGDRMPDAPLASVATGAKTTLFAVLRGTGHHLLLLPGSYDHGALSHLLEIAAETQRAFPGIYATSVILQHTDDAITPDLSAIPQDVPVWLDVEKRLHQRSGATDRALILVRPDGYIGYRAQPADADSFQRYLDRYLVRRNSATSGPPKSP